MMRREVRTVRSDMPLTVFKRDFPPGAAQRVVALDEADRYAGTVLVAEAHGDADDDHRVADILHYVDTILVPQMTIKEAVAMFENAEKCQVAEHCWDPVGLAIVNYAYRFAHLTQTGQDKV
jgi:CIC family chloride channel protein